MKPKQNTSYLSHDSNRFMSTLKIFLASLLSIFFSFSAMATVKYVDSANTSGFQDGLSWASAYTNPQAAINAASSGDSVWIAKGTYQPALNTYYSMKAGVKIFGGFLNTNTSFAQRNYTANVTVLKGNNNSVIRNSNNALTASSVLDGFTISKGIANYGAGIYDSLASPTITNCIFTNNRSNNYGGAIYSVQSALSLTNCIFNNDTSLAGGAVYFTSPSSAPNISQCSFSDNMAFGLGGAVCGDGAVTCSFTQNSFTNNLAYSTYSNNLGQSYGGAVYLFCGATFNQCTFNNNKCTATMSVYASISNTQAYGAAIYVYSIYNANNKAVTVSNCTFSNNTCNATAASTGYNSFGWPNNNSYAYSYGAAICANRKITIAQSSFSGNTTYANASSQYGGATTYSYGGAVYFADTSSISQCTFTGNTSSMYGGAVYADTTSNLPAITQNTFTNNSAALAGGGIYNANRRSVISGCSFLGNTTTTISTSGGAIANAFSSTTSPSGYISNCAFTGNKAKTYGGAIHNYYIGSGYKISNCSFIADSAKLGGAIFNIGAAPIISNALFSQNIADSVGAGVYNYNASPKLTNCTFSRNKATTNGSGLYNASNAAPSVSNSIMWANYSGVFNDASSIANTTYSLIQGFPASSTSFLLAGTTDPLFVDTTGIGNYQLQSTSPCINMGRNDSIPTGITTDLAGNARIYGTTVDMGAYEWGIFPPVVNLGIDTSFCAGYTATLDAKNPGATYLWNTGATTQTIPVTASGTYYVTVTNAAGTAKDTIVVTVNPAPVVNLGNDTTICAGSTLTLNAQNAGASYLWNNNSTAQTLNLSTAGTYYVSVTNTYQCNKKDTINVTVSAIPVVNLGNDTSFCSGNALTLNAQNAGATYLWNNATTSQTLTVDATGTYYVTVTNAGLCSKKDTINVTVNPAPVVNLGNDTSFCAGNTITLNAQNAGQSYLWNNGATTQTINVNASGTYYVEVTAANSCKGRDTVVVTVNPLPIVNLGNDTAICAGNALVLNAQNAGASYLWNNSTTAQTLNVATAGTYSVTVTNANLCKKSDTIQVSVNPLPVVHLGNDTSFCAGNTITLNAQNAGASYLWSNAATTQTINVGTSGTYIVTVTANNCKGRDTIQVVVNPLPVVHLGNDTTIASGFTLILNAGNSGASFVWSTGATTQTLNVTTSGIYSVAVTNSNGCIGKDTIKVTIGGTGIASVQSSGNMLTVYPNPATEMITVDMDEPSLLHTEAKLFDAYGRVVSTMKLDAKTQQWSLSGLAPGIYLLRLDNGWTTRVVKN